jgi:hypothetical protein
MVSSKENKDMHEGGFSKEEASKVASSLGISFDKFSLEALTQGMNVELEHAGVTKKEAVKTAKIALDHLREDPKYYTKLATIEKALGLPQDMDPEHTYVYNTGYHSVRDFWWQDLASNYWRYTNAPVDSEDYDERFGDPLIHPEQPIQSTNPEYFTEDGFKRHQAVAPGFIPQRNPEYDPSNARSTWFEVISSGELTRYIYLDKDIRENLDLWVQYQLRLADANLLGYRKYAYDLYKGDNPKDKVLAVLLMLIDQALFTVEELVNLTIADLKFMDDTIILGGKSLVCDKELLDFFSSLVPTRVPSDPLFVLPTVHGRNSLGYNHVYSLLSSLRMDPIYLLAWHANHMFSKALSRMALSGVPSEDALAMAYEEVSAAFGKSTEDVAALIDTKVRSTLMENYESNGEQESEPSLDQAPVQKSLGASGVRAVYSDLVDRKSDEIEFSVWLHSTPMHDISPAEQERISDAMDQLLEETQAQANMEEDAKQQAGQQPGQDQQPAEGGEEQPEAPPPEEKK